MPSKPSTTRRRTTNEIVKIFKRVHRETMREARAREKKAKLPSRWVPCGTCGRRYRAKVSKLGEHTWITLHDDCQPAA